MSNISGQPTYRRQRFLLAFMRQLNGAVTATDLQKLVFLYSMGEEECFYDFIPYDYGPYSYQLAEDVDILCRDHFLEKKDCGVCAVGNYQVHSLYPIAQERGRKLLRRAYREYPYYTINSTILSSLFDKDEETLFRKEREKLHQEQQVLFTIGYEGKSIDRFINELIQQDIHVLCDVRKNPLSRKFGFSKGKLEHIVEKVGIQYIGIPDLGIESEKRATLNSLEDYQILFISYKTTLPSKKQFLDQIYDLLISKTRVALMCYEKESEMCHRSVIRDYFVEKYKVRSQDL